MKLFKTLLLALCLVLAQSASADAERGSRQDAVALVAKFKHYLKDNGKEKALAEVNAPGAKRFLDRDLYIVVNSLQGVNLAHGANQKLVGKNIAAIKDADDKAFIKEQIETAQREGKGWVSYKWPNPRTGKIDNKVMYFEKVDDMVVACGAYQ